MSPDRKKRSQSAPLIPIFLLSAAALAYEVLLIRLFSIIHWHHFAFMVISIALLGYGASGSFITVFRERLSDHFDAALSGNILLFGLSSIGCFLWVQSIPFNALEILWDVSQWQRLLLTYVLLALPFFFVANAIALSMVRFPQQIALIYAYDLIGAGLGAVVVMLLMRVVAVEAVLRCVALLGLCAGWFLLRGVNTRLRGVSVLLLLCCVLAIGLMPQSWLQLRVSEFKGLSQTLLVKDTTLLWTQNSPIARIDVVESPFIPFRQAPGLSLQSPSGPPRQLAVFSDADAMTTIDHVSSPESLRYSDYLSSALPYHVHPNIMEILLLDTGSGAAILQAAYQSTSHVTAVEPDKHLSSLASDRFAEFTDWSRIRNQVTVHNMTARSYAAFASNAGMTFDLISLGPSAASLGAAAGVDSLTTSYSLTSEALENYLQLLAPNGFISLTEWTSNPPRGSLKLFVTVVAAMKNVGISKPEDNLAWIRSWNTTTLLIKNTAMTPDDIERVRSFSLVRGFDFAWLPDIKSDEVNQFQRLQKPLFYLTAMSMFDPLAIQHSKDNILSNYQYAIEPVTDNRPFPGHFFKWSSLREFLSLPGRSGLSMVEVGYPTLLITLGQAMLAGLVFILLPLAIIRKNHGRVVKLHRSVFTFFASIGLAFLLIEMAVIERLILILGQPLYAVAVALSAFLIFSGLGSLFVQLQLQRLPQASVSRLLSASVLAIVVLSLFYVAFLSKIGSAIMVRPEIVRIVLAFVLIAPLAFAMGMPFPLGLARLQSSTVELIPWAWGINGCASVLSAILAILLAMEIGFSGVMVCAVVLYIVAWQNAWKTV